MKRREFMAIAGGAIAWPIEGWSQQASRTRRVAFLALTGADDSTFIKERLKELGYQEGENLIFDLRSARGQVETLGELASELVKTNPDVIVTGFGTATAMVALPQLQMAARARGQQLAICDARGAAEVENSLAAAARAGAGGLMVLETPILIGLRQRIVDVAAALRMPAVYSVRDFVDAGGLLSYGPDRRQLYRRAAELVDKILKGEKPAEIPVEQPTRFNLIVNLKAAKALELAIPANVLALADEVIE
jgi:ABC-type uncharacterized transport system substrate-binding protein